ncbi:GNAT family N-acetyltransferase [Paraglaciecola sp. 25GB23A]|uniref:GNAT family N-acetyltransferase n=1 Tax=Paraglaciecola sp. 25GB23A TaxID=3156068 RepID=UPI0032AECE23
MKNQIYIREMSKSDIPKVKTIIDDNQMFPAEYIDEMTVNYFNQETEDMWFILEQEDAGIIAVAYCSPERMTEGTWNLLLIAVLKQFQGCGVGSKLITFIEDKLKTLLVRVLLVETSGLPEYELTRDFYPKCGYKQVAVIPEYYAIGDDKIVFCKHL